jgi:hypothetical protein
MRKLLAIAVMGSMFAIGCGETSSSAKSTGSGPAAASPKGAVSVHKPGVDEKMESKTETKTEKK